MLLCACTVEAVPREDGAGPMDGHEQDHHGILPRLGVVTVPRLASALPPYESARCWRCVLWHLPRSQADAARSPRHSRLKTRAGRARFAIPEQAYGRDPWRG